MCLSEDVPLGLCRNVGSGPSQAKRSPYQPSLASQPGANPFCLEHGLILFLSPPTCLVQQYFRFLFGLAWSSCSWLPTGACFGLLLFLPVCWCFWKPPTKYFQEFCVLLLHAFCRPFPWARVPTYVFFVCCLFCLLGAGAVAPSWPRLPTLPPTSPDRQAPRCEFVRFSSPLVFPTFRSTFWGVAWYVVYLVHTFSLCRIPPLEPQQRQEPGPFARGRVLCG